MDKREIRPRVIVEQDDIRCGAHADALIDRMAKAHVLLIDDQTHLGKLVPHQLHAAIRRGVVHHHDLEVFCRPAVQALETCLNIIDSIIVWYHDRRFRHCHNFLTHTGSSNSLAPLLTSWLPSASPSLASCSSPSAARSISCIHCGSSFCSVYNVLTYGCPVTAS